MPRAAGQRVRVEAVVLFADPSAGSLIIHDGTAGCYNGLNFYTTAPENRPKFGDRVLFEGFTRQDGPFPHLMTQTCRILGRGVIPEPHRLTADELYQQRFDSEWVEVPAMVTGVESGGIAYTLAVEVFGQTFKADVPKCPDAAERAAALMQRPARMRAILGTVFSQHRQMTGRHFLVPSFDEIRPSAPIADGDGAPLVTVLQLLGRNFSPTDLVRVEGVITQDDAKGFHLRDGSGSVRVQAVWPGTCRPARGSASRATARSRRSALCCGRPK